MLVRIQSFRPVFTRRDLPGVAFGIERFEEKKTECSTGLSISFLSERSASWLIRSGGGKNWESYLVVGLNVW